MLTRGAQQTVRVEAGVDVVVWMLLWRHRVEQAKARLLPMAPVSQCSASGWRGLRVLSLAVPYRLPSLVKLPDGARIDAALYTEIVPEGVF